MDIKPAHYEMSMFNIDPSTQHQEYLKHSCHNIMNSDVLTNNYALNILDVENLG